MNKSILIADSGSTKTDWLLTDGTHEQRLLTAGINPIVQAEATVFDTLRRLTENVPARAVGQVWFYGAGCIGEYRELMVRLLRRVFPEAQEIEAASDLLGAARAVCGREEGIACILGTGSNSCLYDGGKMVANVPPLGYILGDEGSGACLGKLFLNALLKGDLPQTMLDDFYATTGLSYADIIRRVYREPQANRFLASTSLYIRAHAGDEAVARIIRQSMQAFFEKNVAKYDRPDLPVSAVGSIAQAYEPFFREAAAAFGYRVGRIMKSPIEGLAVFHKG